METNENYPDRMPVKRLKTISLLILVLVTSLLLELIFNAIRDFHPKLTLLEHVQSSLTLFVLFNIILIGFICIVFVFRILVILSSFGILNIYIILLKFFELIPPLIDTINLLLIYHYKVKHFYEDYGSDADSERKKTIHTPTRFLLTLSLTLIRLIINTNFIRGKYNYAFKRKCIVLFDLFLLMLTNVSLIRYANKNLFRIGRKVTLLVLIYQLNDLFFNETFWVKLIEWNQFIKRKFESKSCVKRISSMFYYFANREEDLFVLMIHLMFYIRWIISSFIIFLFGFYICKSIIILDDGNAFWLMHIRMILRSHRLVSMMSIVLFCFLRWDTLDHINALDQYGIAHFCIGFNLWKKMKSTKTFSLSQTNLNPIIEESPR